MLGVTNANLAIGCLPVVADSELPSILAPALL